LIQHCRTLDSNWLSLWEILMRLVPLVAVLALVFATPAFAQTSPAPTPAPAGKEKAEKSKSAKSDKAKSGERSNKGGAMRGEERAGSVKEMNNTRKSN
jgi:hypothetical protein